MTAELSLGELRNILAGLLDPTLLKDSRGDAHPCRVTTSVERTPGRRVGRYVVEVVVIPRLHGPRRRRT